jgi:hypothetical protein
LNSSLSEVPNKALQRIPHVVALFAKNTQKNHANMLHR